MTHPTTSYGEETWKQTTWGIMNECMLVATIMSLMALAVERQGDVLKKVFELTTYDCWDKACVMHSLKSYAKLYTKFEWIIFRLLYAFRNNWVSWILCDIGSKLWNSRTWEICYSSAQLRVIALLVWCI